MLLGYSQEDLPIWFDEETSEFVYKDTRVSFYLIKEAIDSGLSEVQITDTLTYTDTGFFVNFGCLTLTKETVQQLITQTWKQLKKSNKVGS